ncbi:conserved hypothetical protein [Neospora caninum Liverpool]|uniref:Uncharacterized protein n=1 Tax=Neospora caninum (strain Liverpool) TaxID=572307 RepID=F0V760_NEOCL|nr:conserved hypothetical protein [Neospora caninum Liverpool]CBZ49551.1 conserved hypothetical protein [Neospora caninum Liverpool]|eukprot:XP_003879586.1 conserved hypothetical protein [Neospora caninum Liverpool]
MGMPVSPQAPQFTFTGPPPPVAYTWPPGSASGAPQQPMLPPNLALANAEIAALVDLYQQQLAEITAEHSLLLEDQAKLAAFIAPYLDEEGRVVGEFDDTLLLFKQGLDLRLLEYEEDCRRIQQTERRLQRHIDDICLSYDSMVMEAQGYAESRLLGQVKELQRVIWILHSELDELRFQRDIFADETKRLRGICRFGHWIQDVSGFQARGPSVFVTSGTVVMVLAIEKNPSLTWHVVNTGRGGMQQGMVRWPRPHEADKRGSRRAAGFDRSPHMGRSAKSRDEEAGEREGRSWQQPWKEARDSEEEEGRRRGSKAKKREEQPSLFQGVLSKLMWTAEGKDQLDKDGVPRIPGKEVPGGERAGVIFPQSRGEEGRRKSTHNGQRLHFVSATAAVDGSPRRTGPPRVIEFKSGREGASRKTRASGRRSDSEEEEDERRPAGRRVADLPRRREGRERDEVREARERRPRVRRGDKVEDEGVRTRPELPRDRRASAGAVAAAKDKENRRANGEVAGAPATMERKRVSDYRRASGKAGLASPRRVRSDNGFDLGDGERPARFAEARRKTEEARGRPDFASGGLRDWRKEKQEVRREDVEASSGGEQSDVSPREAEDSAWKRADSVVDTEADASEAPSARDGAESELSEREFKDEDWGEEERAKEESVLESESDSSPPARGRDRAAGFERREPGSPAPPPISPYYYERDNGRGTRPRRFASRTVASPLVQSVAPSPQLSPRVPLSRLESGAFLGTVESPLPSARGPAGRRASERRSNGRGRASAFAPEKLGKVGRSPSRTLASPLASARSAAGGPGMFGPRRMLSVASRGTWEEDESAWDSSGSRTFGGDGDYSSRRRVSPLDLSNVRR